MNQFWQVAATRDWWPRATGALIENLDWLQNTDCFRPRFIACPDQTVMDIPANSFRIVGLSLLPGSWLVGLSQVNSDSLDFQITDLSTNNKLFSAPLSAALLSNSGGFFSPFILPEPYMLAGNGSVRVEVFNNTAAASNNSQIVLHIMEPKYL